MAELTYSPIRTWPEGWRDPNRERTRSPFGSTFTQTMNLLDAELWHLDVERGVIQLDVADRAVRRDGSLRADVAVHHPGVILSIDTPRFGTLVYSCDRFDQPPYNSHAKPWHENLRAIALGLEALRKVERYGIATRGEQYAGYKELGSGIPMGSAPAPTMTVDEAVRLMAKTAGMPSMNAQDIIDDPSLADALYKLAAKKCHPDVGGDAELFKRVGEARRIVAGAWRRV